MTGSAPTTAAPTAGQILFTAGDDTIDVLAGSLHKSDVVSTLDAAFASLARAGRKVVAREVSAVAARLLDRNVTDLLLSAWTKHVALIDAGRRTSEAPGSHEVVELLTHRIASIHRPSVALMIDGARVATINFELALSFLVKGFCATVHSGELVHVHSGTCEVSATFSAEGIEIARGEGTFDLQLGLQLGQPFRLWPVTPEALSLQA